MSSIEKTLHVAKDRNPQSITVVVYDPSPQNPLLLAANWMDVVSHPESSGLRPMMKKEGWSLSADAALTKKSTASIQFL